MQASLDKERRRDLRQKILSNIVEIAGRTDSLERIVSETSDHIRQNDRYFFQQHANLVADETYGSDEELEELNQDTDQVISRLENARARLHAACRFTHIYDYRSNPFFSKYVEEQAGYL